MEIIRGAIYEGLEVLSGRMETPVEDEDAEEPPRQLPSLPAGQKRRGRKAKNA
jgi:hypothetical protein